MEHYSKPVSLHERFAEAQRYAIPGSYELVETGRIVEYAGIGFDGVTLEPSVLYCEPERPHIMFHSTLDSWTAKVEVNGEMVEKFRYLGATVIQNL